jgi:hypothetical protein
VCFAPSECHGSQIVIAQVTLKHPARFLQAAVGSYHHRPRKRMLSRAIFDSLNGDLHTVSRYDNCKSLSSERTLEGENHSSWHRSDLFVSSSRAVGVVLEVKSQPGQQLCRSAVFLELLAYVLVSPLSPFITHTRSELTVTRQIIQTCSTTPPDPPYTISRPSTYNLVSYYHAVRNRSRNDRCAEVCQRGIPWRH